MHLVGLAIKACYTMKTAHVVGGVWRVCGAGTEPQTCLVVDLVLVILCLLQKDTVVSLMNENHLNIQQP